MDIVKTSVLDVWIIKPKVFGDHRGWFMESWSAKSFEVEGFHYHFVQDNHSFSQKKGTLRGLHFQTGKYSQAKLVRCTKGAVLDVAVDLRVGSPTYKKWVAVDLSAENKNQLLIPKGFAHGFLTLTDNVEFLYKADNYYEPQVDSGLRWNDPDIGVDWECASPVLSDKDAKLPFLKDMSPGFTYEVIK